MICIRCQHDSKAAERRSAGAEGNCPKCGKPFAFDNPSKQNGISDKAFLNAIESVSAQGKVRWGVEHLYYELRRRLRKTYGPQVMVCFVAFCILATLVTDAVDRRPTLIHGVLAAIVAILAVVLLLVMKPLRGTLDRGDFERMWDRWGQVHARSPSLIQRKPQLPEHDSRAARAAEPDLEDYSFDRAVICDRARTADLLLANNFHFENNCAVLSFDGYPKQAFDSVRRMLKRNPRLEVYALHDATPEGCRLARRLAEDPQWFRGQAHIIDVGLRPLHAGPFDGLLLEASGPVSPGQGISDSEAEWLSKHRLELAAIRPEQVLRRLFKAISRQPARPSLAPAAIAASTLALAGTAAAAHPKDDPNAAAQKKPKDTGGDGGGGGADSDSGWTFDSDSFSADADASDGGADSFG